MRHVIAAAALLAACGESGPCAEIDGACVAVRIESSTVDRIDQLELDVLYCNRHAYATTVPAGGGAVSLPISTAIVLSRLFGPCPIGVVAAGKLGATVVGTGAASATQATAGAQLSITIELSPIGDCVDGGLYCGGDQLAGEPDTLYQCDRDGVPKARGRCLAGCIVRATGDDTCRARDDGQPGPCTEGGRYCGGNELEGDPRSLYTCQADGTGIRQMVCDEPCHIEAAGTDDRCL